MSLTVGSNIFKCTYQQAKFVAECAGLNYKITSKLEVKKEFPHINYYGGIYDYWEDKQTCGGGCRIVWCNNIVWITRHSGYEYADITEDVMELFSELGCENLEEKYSMYNPFIYGEQVTMKKFGIVRTFKDGD